MRMPNTDELDEYLERVGFQDIYYTKLNTRYRIHDGLGLSICPFSPVQAYKLALAFKGCEIQRSGEDGVYNSITLQELWVDALKVIRNRDFKGLLDNLGIDESELPTIES